MSSDSQSRIISSKREAFNSDCLKRTTKFLGLWGCMSLRGLGRFQFIEGTVDV